MLQSGNDWIVLVARGFAEALKTGLMVSVPVFMLLMAVDLSSLILHKVSLKKDLISSVVYDNAFTAGMTFFFAFLAIFLMFVLAIFSIEKNFNLK